jgi:hypothetical protein
MAPALDEARHEAVLAAIDGDELPTNTDVLAFAVLTAADALAEGWEKLAYGLSMWVDYREPDRPIPRVIAAPGKPPNRP